MIYHVKLDVQDQLDQKQQLFCVAMQKTEISGSSKSFGKNMLQDKMQKGLPVQGTIADLSGFAFCVPESYPAILIDNDVVFTDDTGINIWTGIAKRWCLFRHGYNERSILRVFPQGDKALHALTRL